MYIGLVLQYHYVRLDQMNMNIDSVVVATEGTTMCNPPEYCQANADENPLDDCNH